MLLNWLESHFELLLSKVIYYLLSPFDWCLDCLDFNVVTVEAGMDVFNTLDTFFLANRIKV